MRTVYLSDIILLIPTSTFPAVPKAYHQKNNWLFDNFRSNGLVSVTAHGAGNEFYFANLTNFILIFTLATEEPPPPEPSTAAPPPRTPTPPAGT